MIKIKEAIVVEGNYDKIKLSRLVDTAIIVTDGFMIFKNKPLLKLISDMADSRGVIVFTDSDRAGFQIRNYIKNVLCGKNIKHAYIPDIEGKEKRKAKPSKEGFLGVEGVRDDIILNSLKNAATVDDSVSLRKITKADFCLDGISGGGNSRIKRTALLKKLGFPQRMSANMLLDVMNTIYGYDEYKKIIGELFTN